jgi:GNAT superfamily N-acetyltransferase
MPHPVRATDREQLLLFCELPGLSALTPEEVARHRPQESLMLLEPNGHVVARCSLWWRDTPSLPGTRLGLIGHYAARDSTFAADVLRPACERLADEGCTLAVGPLDGATWNRYRLLSERGSEPLFFLEPDNPDDWPAHFTEQGFTPLAQYYSAVTAADATPASPPIPSGMTLRPLDLNRFDEELRRIHALSLEGFRDNFLYSPTSGEDFLTQYRGIRPYVRPELVLLLERQGRLIGYLFGVPDWLQAKRGDTIDTAIAKTMAVHADHRGEGLGTLLLALFSEAAARLGYRRVIHALMHEDNRSRRISAHTASTIRRYTLYARPLGGRA